MAIKDWKIGKLPFGLQLERKPIKMFFRINPNNDVMVYMIEASKSGKGYNVTQVIGDKKAWWRISNVVMNATLKDAEMVLKLKLNEW